MKIDLDWHGFTQRGYETTDDHKIGDKLYIPIPTKLRVPGFESGDRLDVHEESLTLRSATFKLRPGGVAECWGCAVCDPRREEKLIEKAVRETLLQAGPRIAEQATATARATILKGRVIGLRRGYVEVAAGNKAADMANPWLIPIDRKTAAKRLERQTRALRALRAKRRREEQAEARAARRRR